MLALDQHSDEVSGMEGLAHEGFAIVWAFWCFTSISVEPGEGVVTYVEVCLPEDGRCRRAWLGSQFGP